MYIDQSLCDNPTGAETGYEGAEAETPPHTLCPTHPCACSRAPSSEPTG